MAVVDSGRLEPKTNGAFDDCCGTSDPKYDEIDAVDKEGGVTECEIDDGDTG